jgi:hypothetical protein
MDEAVHALATAALADGVKRLARSCRTIESVELTVTMPQGAAALRSQRVALRCATTRCPELQGVQVEVVAGRRTVALDHRTAQNVATSVRTTALCRAMGPARAHLP